MLNGEELTRDRVLLGRLNEWLDWVCTPSSIERDTVIAANHIQAIARQAAAFDADVEWRPVHGPRHCIRLSVSAAETYASIPMYWSYSSRSTLRRDGWFLLSPRCRDEHADRSDARGGHGVMRWRHALGGRRVRTLELARESARVLQRACPSASRRGRAGRRKRRMRHWRSC